MGTRFEPASDKVLSSCANLPVSGLFTEVQKESLLLGPVVRQFGISDQKIGGKFDRMPAGRDGVNHRGCQERQRQELADIALGHTGALGHDYASLESAKVVDWAYC
jgi:hypothetical protein